MDHLSIYEVIGMCWVVLTSAFATVAFFFAAYIGVKTALTNLSSRAVPQNWKEGVQ